MPQRHSKNNNDLAFFTYYGTQRGHFGKDSIKPFDACCLCLKPFMDPLCCQKGHVFCKECILECLLAQKRDIKRVAVGLIAFIFDMDGKLAGHAAQQKQEKEEEEEKLMLQKARELDAFEHQNHGAVLQYSDRSHACDKNGFNGPNSVMVTSYEEEALRNMKAFWLPSATAEAPVNSEALSADTICPKGKRKLRLKTSSTLPEIAMNKGSPGLCKAVTYVQAARSLLISQPKSKSNYKKK
ncbi:putative E3 ubiquitin-protein ligase CSU1 [Cocos nucifera]|uniref:Putative E3 ubiquitin-protein ligase CSU1 n=1 Tax=Cocos nucifera TaxID=13894 RepID=A0A8K0ICD9_COCNU|nr:putative E3 ubiquitin-protein ligase CSU1 [Cocos nucifera]